MNNKELQYQINDMKNIIALRQETIDNLKIEISKKGITQSRTDDLEYFTREIQSLQSILAELESRMS